MDINRPIKRPHPPALGCVVVLFITLVPAFIIIMYTKLDGVIGMLAILGLGWAMLAVIYPILAWLGRLK